MKEKVPVPPPTVQKGIVALLRLENRVQGSITGLNTLLREYRARLVSDVVTGKLDVREAAALLPAELSEPDALDEAEDAGDGEEVDADDTEEVPEEAEA